MKFIKASDRTPDENENLVWRFLDKSGVHRGFIGGEFQFKASVRMNTILHKQFKDEIEWLDESEEDVERSISSMSVNRIIEEYKKQDSNENVVKVGSVTRYGVIEEFIEIDGKIMMRTKNPYGTWPIEPIK